MTDELPPHDIDTANHAGLRVRGYTAEAVRAGIDAAVARELETVRQLRSVLRVIAEQDPVENCLDPQWAARIAKGGLDATAAAIRKGG